jgi:hypothetical protein
MICVWNPDTTTYCSRCPQCYKIQLSGPEFTRSKQGVNQIFRFGCKPLMLACLRQTVWHAAPSNLEPSLYASLLLSIPCGLPVAFQSRSLVDEKDRRPPEHRMPGHSGRSARATWAVTRRDTIAKARWRRRQAWSGLRFRRCTRTAFRWRLSARAARPA